MKTTQDIILADDQIAIHHTVFLSYKFFFHLRFRQHNFGLAGRSRRIVIEMPVVRIHYRWMTQSTDDPTDQMVRFDYTDESSSPHNAFPMLSSLFVGIGYSGISKCVKVRRYLRVKLITCNRKTPT